MQPETKLSFSWHWKSEPGVETFVSVLLGGVTQAHKCILSTQSWAVHRCMTTLPAGRVPLESWSVRSQRSHEMPNHAMVLFAIIDLGAGMAEWVRGFWAARCQMAAAGIKRRKKR